MKTSEELNELLLNVVPCRILTYIYEANENLEKPTIHDAAKAVGTTDSHANKLVNKFEDMDLLAREVDGRKKPIDLTDKGRETAIALRAFTEE